MESFIQIRETLLGIRKFERRYGFLGSKQAEKDGIHEFQLCNNVSTI